MALDASKEQGSSSSTSSSSSSSNSDSPSITEKYRNRTRRKDEEHYDWVCPEVVIRETGDGLETIRYPHTQEISVGRGTEQLPQDRLPNDWVRYWTYKGTWRAKCKDVKEFMDIDLDSLVDEDPQSAIDAIVFTAKNFDKSHRKRDTAHVECVLCGDEHHRILSNKYSKVNKRIVCDNHTVGQLSDHDII